MKDEIVEVLIIIALVAVITSWIWLPPTVAQLTYGDWTCAYKKCVVIINGDDR